MQGERDFFDDISKFLRNYCPIPLMFGMFNAEKKTWNTCARGTKKKAIGSIWI